MIVEVYEREKGERDLIKVCIQLVLEQYIRCQNTHASARNSPKISQKKAAGVSRSKKIPVKGSKKSANATGGSGSGAGTSAAVNGGPGGDDAECYTCRANLYVSWIHCDDDDAIYCLHHGLKQINGGRLKAAACQMLYAYSIQDVEQLIGRIRGRSAQAMATTNSLESSPASPMDDNTVNTKPIKTTAPAKNRKSTGRGK